MTARKVSQAELITKIVESRMADMTVSVPAEIVSYNPALNEAEVQPLVYDESERPEPMSAPVRFASHGGFAMSWAPEKGDHCTLLFHHVDAASFLALPTGAARAELLAGTSCECWPGNYILPGHVLPGIAWWGDSEYGTGIAQGPAGIQLGGTTAVEPLVLGTQLSTLLTNLTTALDVFATTVSTTPCVIGAPVHAASAAALKVSLATVSSAIAGTLSTTCKTS